MGGGRHFRDFEKLGKGGWEMTTLYHGSYMPVPKPLAKAGRKNLDFGQGFYLTSILEQAKSWAEVIASRRGRTIEPVVSKYQFDELLAKNENVRWKVFPCYDLEWLEFVIKCRSGFNPSEHYDIVEGGVANDNVIDTVEDYEKGIITAEQALGQLRYKHVNHQLCILSQQIIDKCLHYMGKELLQ